MVQYFIRAVKRFAVLIPGLLMTYLAYRNIYPYLDRRSPAILALFVTYLITAYGLIPGMLRLWRLIVPAKHIPLYSTTPDGFASDPVNIGIVATRKQLVAIMAGIGWHQADERTPRNLIRYIYSLALRQPYLTAPFSHLYLFGRRQDLGFQLPFNDDPRHRHHVRFWGVTDASDPQYREHTIFWLRHHKAPKPGKLLWVGAASLDIGLAPIKYNAQITHRVAPDTNAERDLIVEQLKATGKVKKIRKVKVGLPYRLSNRALYAYLKADGKMTICEL